MWNINSVMCPVIVPHTRSLYGYAHSCVARTGEGTCLESKTYICDGRLGVVSQLRRKKQKKKPKNTWRPGREHWHLCTHGNGTVLLDVLFLCPPAALKHTHIPSWLSRMMLSWPSGFKSRFSRADLRFFPQIWSQVFFLDFLYIMLSVMNICDK